MKPVVIAQVSGVAAAAGCQLVAACDLALAAQDSTRFGLTGINLGLVCSTPIVHVSRCVPHAKLALEMLLAGDPITAEQAAGCGLINRAVPDDTLEEETVKLARRIAQHSTNATSRGKEMIYKQLEMPIEDATRYTSKRIVDDIQWSHDAQRGISAFLQKEVPPKWTGT
jgi:enoyl-CoA hydratase/carnithine racemase